MKINFTPSNFYKSLQLVSYLTLRILQLNISGSENFIVLQLDIPDSENFIVLQLDI